MCLIFITKERTHWPIKSSFPELLLYHVGPTLHDNHTPLPMYWIWQWVFSFHLSFLEHVYQVPVFWGSSGRKNRECILPKTCVVVYTYDPSDWEDDARQSGVQGHPGVHSDCLFRKSNLKSIPASFSGCFHLFNSLTSFLDYKVMFFHNYTTQPCFVVVETI